MRVHGLGDHIRVIRGGNTEESGVTAAHALLGVDPRPTAVLTFNDRAAMGLLDALVRAGVDVPGAMSGVGYDDSPFSRLAHIELTTVSQNIPELTEHAVAAVIERLDGGRTSIGRSSSARGSWCGERPLPRPTGRPELPSPHLPEDEGCSSSHMLVDLPGRLRRAPERCSDSETGSFPLSRIGPTGRNEPT